MIYKTLHRKLSIKKKDRAKITPLKQVVNSWAAQDIQLDLYAFVEE